MLNFPGISCDAFLTQYWQKKPLLIRAAFPHFENPLSANELAGLAMEEEIESRLIIQTPGQPPQWSLRHGPFSKRDFKQLPNSHWTLLVQGVDRFVPQVTALLDHFDFLPQWRFDDVMISYAVKQGGVGPHYDNYDVFLYQAKGCRKWSLTRLNCIASNYRTDTELRIMQEFTTEDEFILEEGDMLYLPPHIGHDGVALSKDCITYSFGYRSYQAQELWDSFGEYIAAKKIPPSFYQDPPWTIIKNTSELPPQAWQQAKVVMLNMLEDEILLKKWFGGFSTSLDRHAESLLPSDTVEKTTSNQFKKDLLNARGLIRNPLCRFAYFKADDTLDLSLYINGCEWIITDVTIDLVNIIANKRRVLLTELIPFLDKSANQTFLYELWKLQWLEYLD